MDDQRPIILWAHARSLSTVFERPFLQLPLKYHVIHEPLVPIGVAYMANNVDFLNNIPLPKPNDPITLAHHLSPTLNEILAPHYYQGDQTRPLRVFVKDLATIFLHASEGNLLRSREILLKFKHTFLIRDPEKSVKSYYNAANATYQAWDKAGISSCERVELFSANLIGLKELRAFYDLIKGETGEEIPLVDADDLIQEPEIILRKYCEMVGVEFERGMLEWKAERVEAWDANISSIPDVPGLYDIWHGNSSQSTGFNKSVKKEQREVDYPQYVYDIIDENKVHYEYLLQHKIKIS
ncbi:517_t:CDS:2 [Acaulospora morrowiae]|uniref:517_t:CDS:1 n=1 Tax=Acaulospora morrowiae TaxID=94023 RepID=A0A9N8VXX0_9GLOM|nr:517_t:CDS:2 [Acaulospora morrowiae]